MSYRACRLPYNIIVNYVQSECGAHEFGVFSRALCTRVPDQFLLSRGGERATVVVTAAAAAVSLCKGGGCGGGGGVALEAVAVVRWWGFWWRRRRPRE